jgi:hypothetical protein
MQVVYHTVLYLHIPEFVKPQRYFISLPKVVDFFGHRKWIEKSEFCVEIKSLKPLKISNCLGLLSLFFFALFKTFVKICYICMMYRTRRFRRLLLVGVCRSASTLL